MAALGDLANGRATAARPVGLAVDVGVSSVKMAWLEGNRIVDSSERGVTFPAVVACRGQDVLVGEDALRLSTSQPEAVLLHAREWLGLVSSVRLAGTQVNIADALTAIYRAAARASVRTTDHPASVIVHPAPWTSRRVTMLADAARAAGLDVVGTVPDAAAVAAVGPREGDVLVIDVGSVLTVSVVDASCDPPQILWSKSSGGAGGEAIAQAISAVAEVTAQRAAALARGAEPAVGERPIDWDAVERQASDGAAAAHRLVDEVLLRSGRDASGIVRVYLAGGASAAPFVSEAVNNRFRSDRTDMVVELTGPSASAAYGALRLTRSEPPQNVWSSISDSAPRVDRQQTGADPAGTRSHSADDRGAAEAGTVPPPPDSTSGSGEGDRPNSWTGPTASLLDPPSAAGGEDRLKTWTAAPAPAAASGAPVTAAATDGLNAWPSTPGGTRRANDDGGGPPPPVSTTSPDAEAASTSHRRRAPEPGGANGPGGSPRDPATAGGRRRSGRSSQSTGRRRRRMVVLAIALAVVLLATIVAIAASSDDPQNDRPPPVPAGLERRCSCPLRCGDCGVIPELVNFDDRVWN